MDTTYHIHNSFLCLSTSAVANHQQAIHLFTTRIHLASLEASSVSHWANSGLLLFLPGLAGVRAAAAAAGRQDILLLNIGNCYWKRRCWFRRGAGGGGGREDVAAVNKLLFRDVVQSTLTVRRQRFVCNGTKYTNSI